MKKGSNHIGKKGKYVVLCCQCGGHFERDSVNKLRIENINYNFYICHPCLENVPRLSEHVVKPISRV